MDKSEDKKKIETSSNERNESEDAAKREASLAALYKAQADFAGVAEEMGLESEEDIQRLVDETRYGKK